MNPDLDTIHATVQAEVTARAEKLARMQGLQARIQKVMDLQAQLNAEGAAIQVAFEAEMGLREAVTQ